MNAYHFLALFIVFTGSFVTLGAIFQARRGTTYDLHTQADRRTALRNELRLVR
jgi:hypothetical protein